MRASLIGHCCLILSLLLVTNLRADPASPDADALYLARIQVHTALELDGLLQRADALYQQQQGADIDPVVFVLHGVEGRVFLREGYNANKELVDLAARLSALRVVDIRVCERWMGSQGIAVEELQPFVETVPSGPAEIDRLMRTKNYVYF